MKTYLLLITLLLLKPPAALAEVTFKASPVNQRVISALPRVLFQGESQVVTVFQARNNSEFAALTLHLTSQKGWDKRWQGVFVPSESTVYLKSLPLEKPLLLHEVGHCVWCYHLTNEQKEEYNTLWTIENSGSCLPSQYSYTSEEEGFAEAFRIYFGGKEWPGEVVSSLQKNYFKQLASTQTGKAK